MKPDELLNRIESGGFCLYVDGETLKSDPDTMSPKQRNFVQANAWRLIIALYDREKQLTLDLLREMSAMRREKSNGSLEFLKGFIAGGERAKNSQPALDKPLLQKVRILIHPDRHNNSRLSTETFKAIEKIYSEHSQ